MQGDRRIHGEHQVLGSDVVFGALKFHVRAGVSEKWRLNAGGAIGLSVGGRYNRTLVLHPSPLDCPRKMKKLMLPFLALLVTSVTTISALAQEVQGDVKALEGLMQKKLGFQQEHARTELSSFLERWTSKSDRSNPSNDDLGNDFESNNSKKETNF